MQHSPSGKTLSYNITAIQGLEETKDVGRRWNGACKPDCIFVSVVISCFFTGLTGGAIALVIRLAS